MTAKTKVKVKTIEEVQEVLRRIHNISNGGCGIAALAIHRWLKKSDLRASSMIVFGHRDYKTFSTNAKALIDSTNKPSSATHIGVLIYDYDNNKQMVIDCNGIFDITSYLYANLVSDKFLLKSINECDQWNERFNRRNNVQWIAESLDIDLSDVDLRTDYEYRNPTTKLVSYADAKEAQVEEPIDAAAMKAAIADITRMGMHIRCI